MTGMSCAACVARVEKAVGKLDGVESCSVSLLTNSMGIEGEVSDAEIIKAVEEAGYGAAAKDSGNSEKKNRDVVSELSDSLVDRETPKLRKRLISSLGFLLVLMYFSMGHMMWGWPIPNGMVENPAALGLLQMLLTIIVMVINQKFFVSGFTSLVHGAPNMDTLVALGAGASFGWSVFVIFDMMLGGSYGVHDFYFESAAMILTLITVGKMLEAHSKGKTTDALKGLMQLAPKTASVIREMDGLEEEVTIPVDDVKKGEIFVVRPGESIPVDGIVIAGASAVNEAALTGESLPCDKVEGDSVSAATINLSGYIKCQATRVGEDTTLSQIIQMVSDAAATKAPIAKIADKVSGIFVPVVIAIAVVTMLVWMIVGQEIGFSLARAIAVLVISCPCALGLATPVAIMVGNGKGARNGILYKTAASLEAAGRIEIVALDKTGTITNGEPVVTDIVCYDCSEKQLLHLAASLEAKSEHPLSKAVTRAAQERKIEITDVADFKVLPGNGLCAKLDGEEIIAGSVSYVSSRAKEVEEKITTQADEFAKEGKTPLLFATNQKIVGMMAVADTVKEDSPEAINQLRNMGIRVVMLTGDNEETAKAIGKIAGVDEVIAGVLPNGKEEVIRRLMESGKVAMVGDGINDAPALTRADVGIAIGAGTDVALDAADVVLMKSNLLDVPAAIRLGRRTLLNIKENLFWAFIYNIIGIPLAAGIYYALWGWQLNPMFGAAAMSLSSFCVVSNALRLNLTRIYSTKHDRNHSSKKEIEIINSNKGEINMTKTMKIEGMMCGHCEARVKKTLEALEGVTEAVVSHEAGTAVVTLAADVASDVLKDAVEAQDYKVISVE